jgi:AAA15 family ATPase/GTPase
MEKTQNFAKHIFRADKIKNLFPNSDDSTSIEVEVEKGTDKETLSMSKKSDNKYTWKLSGQVETQFNNDFKPMGTSYQSGFIRPYQYNSQAGYDAIYDPAELQPPFGSNLIEVLENDTSLLSDFGEIFEDQGYRMVIDSENKKLVIFKDTSKGVSFLIPLMAISDTLKRLMFYVAAIRSNANHILTLEEPEVHSFPPFVSYLGDEIIKSTNQFFLTTHSPYLLNHLIEKAPKGETSVFVCDHENYQTTVKRLSDEELSELLNYGVDIFFNIARYANH